MRQFHLGTRRITPRQEREAPLVTAARCILAPSFDKALASSCSVDTLCEIPVDRVVRWAPLWAAGGSADGICALKTHLLPTGF